MDAHGFLWNAEWGSGKVVRYGPDGRIDHTIDLPISQATCVAFGGEDLSDLYVSTAKIGLTEEALKAEPRAGHVFVFETSVRGLREVRFIARDALMNFPMGHFKVTGLLQDKSVMITGAAAGIGLGIARVCAGAGASLVLADVNLEALVESSRSLAADSTRIQTVKLDVSNTTEVKQFFQDLAERCGGIDGLVNNAGVTIESEFLQFPEDEVERLWQTNLRSVFFMCQEAAKLMKSRRGGSIVNVASVHAIASRPGHEMYAATKGGIAAMTRAMS